MFKCQVLWKPFICLILSKWRSHFYDHWCHPVFFLIPWTFAGTVAKNEKHFLLFSSGIPYNTTVASDPNDFFPTASLAPETISSLQKQLQSKLLFDPQIHSFSCVLLAMVFVFIHIYTYNTDFKKSSLKRGEANMLFFK